MERTETGAPIAESEMPPSRPNWKILLGAVVAVLAAVALLHEHQLVQMLGMG